MTNSIILGSEEFRQIYDSDYYISRDGLVVNNKTHYIIKPTITPLGYVVFHISIKGKRIQKYAQRLVWETYKGDVPNGYDIDHIDNNKLNNKLDNKSEQNNSFVPSFDTSDFQAVEDDDVPF